jgi:hypothetical protein
VLSSSSARFANVGSSPWKSAPRGLRFFVSDLPIQFDAGKAFCRRSRRSFCSSVFLEVIFNAPSKLSRVYNLSQGQENPEDFAKELSRHS